MKTRLYLSLLKSVFTTTKSQTPIPSIFAEIWRGEVWVYLQGSIGVFLNPPFPYIFS